MARFWQRWSAAELWQEGPWVLLGATAVAAPFAVLDQGGDGRTAMVAALACLASPCFGIELMQGVARLALAFDRR